MALEKTIVDKVFGLTVPNAYLKLAYFRWSDADNKAIATFSVFSTVEARNNDKTVIGTIDIDVTDNFTDLQNKLYSLGKSHSELLSSKDV